VMDNPAPFACFEKFGESTLDIVLRCYLESLDERLQTINDLHTSIDREFKKAGIEIAFPQRDIHLRTTAQPVPSEGPAN
ncbi:MAG: mechanosensitive ion channel, partial [Pirellulales bacterium]|nr:mechanosensitive ion channel [Pirellulales bacterium]